MEHVRVWRNWRGILFAWGAGPLLLIAGLVLAGCSSDSAARRVGFSRVVTPLPPAFLIGPCAFLLTNSSGFSSVTELDAENSVGTQRPSNGQLLGRGSKLLYVPASDEEPTERHHRPGEYSFIWDVAQGSGYVLSEALQGYAPISTSLRVTNIEVTPTALPAQKLAGHPCQPFSIRVRSSEGTISGFTVFRALDLDGFPVKIETVTNAMPFVLNLSKIRVEIPRADIFLPPDGFTKYPNPEAMADEIAAREHNLRRTHSGPPVMDLYRPGSGY